jgi:type II secretory pathway predicted ATPase ExeA
VGEGLCRPPTGGAADLVAAAHRTRPSPHSSNNWRAWSARRARQQLHLTEEEIALKLRRAPKPLFVDQANYLGEQALGTLCFLWERQRLPIILTGTKHLYDTFFQSRLTEEVRGQLSSRIALHYLLPELTQTETRATLQQALGAGATEEVITLIHGVTGGVFRSVDMMIPRLLELKQRNQQKLADGTIKMQDLVKTAASRLML